MFLNKKFCFSHCKIELSILAFSLHHMQCKKTSCTIPFQYTKERNKVLFFFFRASTVPVQTPGHDWIRAHYSVSKMILIGLTLDQINQVKINQLIITQQSKYQMQFELKSINHVVVTYMRVAVFQRLLQAADRPGP